MSDLYSVRPYIYFNNPGASEINLLSIVLEDIKYNDITIVISPEHIDGCQLGIWKEGPEGIHVSSHWRRPKHSHNESLGNIWLGGMSFERGTEFKNILKKCQPLLNGRTLKIHPLGPHVYS